MSVPSFVIFYSKVSAFRQCRKKYWFSYLSGEQPPPEVMNVPGLIGNAVHRGLRWLTETGNAAYGRNEVEVYLRMPDHEICGPGTDGYERALDYFEQGVEVHESIASVDRWAEKDVINPPGASVEIRARIDRIDRLESGEWQIIDWKTGGDFDDATDEQLDLAHVAARSSLRGVMSADAVVRTVAWNLRERANRPGYSPRTRILRREDAAATVGRYRAVARAMQEVADFPAIPGVYCRFCDWRERCPESAAWENDDPWAEAGPDD